MSNTISRLEDEQQAELADADRLAHEAFGRDESIWTPWQWAGYFAATNTAREHAGMEAIR